MLLHGFEPQFPHLKIDTDGCTYLSRLLRAFNKTSSQFRGIKHVAWTQCYIMASGFF